MAKRFTPMSLFALVLTLLVGFSARATSLEITESELINIGPIAKCTVPLHAQKGNLGYKVYLKENKGVGKNIEMTFWVLDFQCRNRPPKFLQRFPNKKPVYWNVLQQNPSSRITMKYYDTESDSWEIKYLTKFQRKFLVVDYDYSYNQEAQSNHKKYYSIYKISYPTFDQLSEEQKSQLLQGESIKVFYNLLYSNINKFEFQRPTGPKTLMKSFSSDAFRAIFTIRLTNREIEILESEIITP